MTTPTITLRDGNAGGIRPEFSLDITPERRQVETPEGAGAVFTRQINERARRRWRFQWTAAPEGQRHILEAKWNASKRGVLPMSYLTEDGSETVAVRFVPDSLRITQTGPATYRMSVDAEEDHASTTTAPSGGLNTIVFLIDDAGREYYKCYDNATWAGTPIPTQWANQWGAGTFAYPPTPILDGLAGEGLLLSRFHVAAMCSPTRSSLITGRSNRKHSVGNAIQPPNTEEVEFVGTPLFQLLHDQGAPHERIHIGKWHTMQSSLGPVNGLGPDLDSALVVHHQPVERGFATLFHGNSGNHEIVPGIVTGTASHANYAWCRHDVRDNPRPFTGGVGGPYAGQTDLTFDIYSAGDDASARNSLIDETNAAIAAIEEAAEDDKPFCMNVWYHAVHVPVGWAEMGGAHLSTAGYHSYTTSDPGAAAGRIKAFVESTDTSMGLILDAMTADQRAKTMVVVITDNGSTSTMLTANATPDVLEPAKDTVPASDYLSQHSKRSPWQGGIGAACIINGPAVVNPGDGTAPRVWNGLCGIEDVFRLVAECTGAFVPDDEQNYTDALIDAVRDTNDVGRSSYTQTAFRNGYSEDMFSTDQDTHVRFVSVQNAAGYKLIWIRSGAELESGMGHTAPVGSNPYTTEPPSPSSLYDAYPTPPATTWLWQFYNLNENPLELPEPDAPSHFGDMFWRPNTGWADDATFDYSDKTPGRRWLQLHTHHATEAMQFDELYTILANEGLIPPGMELPV